MEVRKHGEHDQAEHGNWARLGAMAVTSGGFSVSAAGKTPRKGWMASQAGTEQKRSMEALTSEHSGTLGWGPPGDPWRENVTSFVNEFITENAADLSETGVFLGGWLDEGDLYLDVSHNIEDEDEAKRFARENDQLAAYNVETGEYVRFDKARPKKVFIEVPPDADAQELAKLLTEQLFGS